MTVDYQKIIEYFLPYLQIIHSYVVKFDEYLLSQSIEPMYAYAGLISTLIIVWLLVRLLARPSKSQPSQPLAETALRVQAARQPLNLKVPSLSDWIKQTVNKDASHLDDDAHIALEEALIMLDVSPMMAASMSKRIRKVAQIHPSRARLQLVQDEFSYVLGLSNSTKPIASAQKTDKNGQKEIRKEFLDQNSLELGQVEFLKDLVKRQEEKKSDKKSTILIFMVGVNGAGKTSTAAKLAARAQSLGLSVMFAACDTFRAGAIEQLKTFTDALGARLIRQAYQSPPATVLNDAIQAAKADGVDLLFIDTSGRMSNRKDLLEQLTKLDRVAREQVEAQDIKALLVLDGSAGKGSVQQGLVFGELVQISGAVITKLETAASGGAVLDLASKANLPMSYLTFGEQLDDIVPFDIDRFLKFLLDDASKLDKSPVI